MKYLLAFILGITTCYIPARLGQIVLEEQIIECEEDVREAESQRYDVVKEYRALVNSLPVVEYLGEFKITYYCPCTECSKEWGTKIAYPCTDNHEAIAEHTIAVDPDVIPIGSVVMINGVYYKAEDVGSAVTGKTIDVYVSTHEEVIQNGLDYKDVFLVKMEDK